MLTDLTFLANESTALERDPPRRWRAGIDRLVYELYGLTEEEIAVVEGKK